MGGGCRQFDDDFSAAFRGGDLEDNDLSQNGDVSEGCKKMILAGGDREAERHTASQPRTIMPANPSPPPMPLHLHHQCSQTICPTNAPTNLPPTSHLTPQIQNMMCACASQDFFLRRPALPMICNSGEQGAMHDRLKARALRGAASRLQTLRESHARAL